MGTALAEALIVVPVLAALLAGVVGLNNLYSAKLDARARARRHAWLQAESGDCPRLACDAACARARQEVERGALAGAAAASSGRFSSDRFLGDVQGFFRGRVAEGVGTASARLPALVGGGARQTESHVLPCNARGRVQPDGKDIFQYACEADLRNVPYAEGACE
ncbi:MAG: hypothetical protein AAF436_15570 [Myxococcota bacterium]